MSTDLSKLNVSNVDIEETKDELHTQHEMYGVTLDQVLDNNLTKTQLESLGRKLLGISNTMTNSARTVAKNPRIRLSAFDWIDLIKARLARPEATNKEVVTWLAKKNGITDSAWIKSVLRLKIYKNEKLDIEDAIKHLDGDLNKMFIFHLTQVYKTLDINALKRCSELSTVLTELKKQGERAMAEYTRDDFIQDLVEDNKAKDQRLKEAQIDNIKLLPKKDKNLKIKEFIDNGNMTRQEASNTFSVSMSTINRWYKKENK